MAGGVMLIALAWLTPAAAPPPPTPAVPPAIRQLPNYISELPEAGLSPEMFQRPTQPQANLASLFRTQDYPMDAIAKMQEGTVGVVLRVGTDGRVTDCLIESSSGSPALDTQTCRLIWMRARFQPAKDRSGQSVESATRARIRWELPAEELAPLKAWSVRLTVDFVEEGGIVSCKSEATGAMKVDPHDCEFLLTVFDNRLAKIRADAGYKKQRMVMETRFVPSAATLQEHNISGMKLYARQVARITIDESGTPLQCRVIAFHGPDAPEEGCDDLLEGSFEKPDLKRGAIEATVARSLYVEE